VIEQRRQAVRTVSAAVFTIIFNAALAGDYEDGMLITG